MNKIFKRLCLCLLLVALCVSMLPVSVLAAETKKSGKCGDKLTWSLDSSGVLTISGTGKMYDYSNDAPWRDLTVTSLVIKSGVTYVGDDAFFGCNDLKSVTIADTVTQIGDDAFMSCDSLTTVTIPASVTSIGMYAFSYCENLTSIKGCKGVKELGMGAFSDNPKLTTITLPEGLTTIDFCLLGNCTGLTSVTIPASVKVIEHYAFDGCTGLKNIYFAGTQAQWNAMSVGSGNDALNKAKVNFNSGLAITKQPANVTVASGATAKTSVTASGSGLTYTWYFKNKGASSYTKSSTTTNTYSMTMDSTKSGRQVYCVVKDKSGNSVKSNVVTLSMKQTAKITKQPANVTAASGATAKTSITATGDGLTYTWYYKNKGASAYTKSSTTTNTYSTTMDSTRNGRQVYCVVKDKYGNSVKSNVVTLSMGTALKITKQPASVTVASGAAAKTSVTASGSGLTYTWYFKNKGASSYTKSSTTTNTYSMTMDSTKSGRQVYCVVKDKNGNSVKSNVVTLSMKQTAKITKQPANATAASGATVKTSITATGDGLTYTWYFKNKGASSYTKSSTTTNTYSMTMDSTKSGRQVYCVIKDKYGNSVKSSVVTLSMKTVAKITKQPANVTVASGATAKTSITAVGDGLSYTWYYKNKGASAYTKSSTTTNTYSTTMDSSRNGRQVYCVIKDKYGNSVKSNVVTLSMGTALKISKQPANAVAAYGATAKTSVTARGSGLSYTWYYRNVGESAYTKSSITSSTYSIAMDASRNGRQVYCVVKDKSGNSVKSSVATLYMEEIYIVSGENTAFQRGDGKGVYTFTAAKVKIDPQTAKVELTISSNSYFTAGKYTYNLKYNDKSGNYIYYVLTDVNGTKQMTGRYDTLNEQFMIHMASNQDIYF